MKNLSLNARSLNGIDNDLIDQAANIDQHLRARRRRKTAFITTAAGVAACFIFMFGFLIRNDLSDSNIAPPNSDNISTATNQPARSNPPVQTEQQPVQTESSPNPAITGLAVNNFCLSDIEVDNPQALRIAYGDFISFFQWGNSPWAFAYVQVHDSELITHTAICPISGGVYEYETQTAALEIIDVIWSNGESIPETITLTQGIYKGNFLTLCDSVTNLLREGGVYMLPLHYDNRGLGWSVLGDLDVLFEVDDTGKIWSHSPSKFFNKFDGKDTSILTQAIIDLTSDENFNTAVSRFGWNAKTAALAEITVTSVEQSVSHVYTLTDTGERVTEYRYDYVFDANVLSKGRRYAPESGTIPAVSLMVPLEQGQRYLILLEIYGEYETMAAIQPELIAKINDDGTITPYNPLIGTSPYETYWSVFDDFDGYTVEQMSELAEQAKIWHESNPCGRYYCCGQA
jgi:hypothetical protein